MAYTTSTSGPSTTIKTDTSPSLPTVHGEGVGSAVQKRVGFVALHNYKGNGRQIVGVAVGHFGERFSPKK